MSEKLDEEEIATKVLIEDVRRRRNHRRARLRAADQGDRPPDHRPRASTTCKVVDTKDDDTIIKALKKDPAHDQEEALKDIYRSCVLAIRRPSPNARSLLKRLFFDPKRYDLGRVGRYKINQKLGIKVELEERILTKEDFIAAMKYLIELRSGEGMLDDIDHLGSRRVRTVGELLANQCRVGLARTERLVKERMTLFDMSIDG